MEEKIRSALSAPFPADAVKNRRGSFGKPISYVEGNAVISRLNDCFGGDWSFVIVQHQVLSTGEVLVHGRLTALGVSKDSFGRGMPAISRETGEVLSEADAYKSAATDSLKKAATLLGVALQLYSDDAPDQAEPQRPRAVRSAPVNRASARQVTAIWNLGRRLGLDANAIRQRTMSGFGAVPEQLDRETASRAIQDLSDEIDGRQQKGAA